MFDWYRPVPASSLAFFRICFGVLMLFSTIRFISNGWVQDFYINPEFHFSYYGFGWLPYPSDALIYVMFGLMIVFSLLIVVGLLYRLSAIGFFLVFTYVELLDKATYLNHYYFVTLVSLLMIFLPANRFFSLDARFGLCRASETVNAWHLGIIKFQMGIVYFFAGVAKIGSDWLLEAQPLKMWLHSAHHWPVVGNLMKQDWLAYAFSWTGCLFDLTIIFFLLNRRTRNYAYAVVVFFHLITWMLFPIGVFPWVMIVGTTIFLSSDLHKSVLDFLGNIFGFTNRVAGNRHEDTKTRSSPISSRLSVFVAPKKKHLATTVICTYIIFQLVFPLRGFLYSGDMFWTESGYRFSWRVMLMEKAGSAYFYVRDPESGVETEVQADNHLTELQLKQMSYQPDMILQFADYLVEVYKDTTLTVGRISMPIRNPEVRAEVYVSLNGRPSQLYVDKRHNLAQVENDMRPRYWLEEFAE